jgi:hypothetical protein
MRLTGYKNIIILLLLMAFTSQSVAALLMPCQHNAAMHHEMGTMADMPGMEHMHHANVMDSTSKTPIQQTDCCKALGHCSSGGCSLAVFGGASLITFASLRTSVSDLYRNTIPTALSTSLFKPPIFR